jgi:hypothetical protein
VQIGTLNEGKAHWLLGQVRTARELTPAAAAVAAKIEQGARGERRGRERLTRLPAPPTRRVARRLFRENQRRLRPGQ